MFLTEKYKNRYNAESAFCIIIHFVVKSSTFCISVTELFVPILKSIILRERPRKFLSMCISVCSQPPPQKKTKTNNF